MKTPRHLIGTAGWAGLLISALAQTGSPEFVEWEFDGEVSIAPGYRGNVLRSGIHDDGSGFMMTALDLSLMRFSDSGSYLIFYFFGEDRRYYDAPSVGYEQFFSGIVNGKFPVNETDSLGFRSGYVYQHQIYDASETGVDQRRLLVLGHSVQVHPFWEHAFSEAWHTQLKGGVLRQYYEQELDDFTEVDGTLSLVRYYGHGSKLSLGYQWLFRGYDTRAQYDETGAVIEGSALNYVQNELLLESSHYFDPLRRWKLSGRLTGMLNRDNGAGYFDYDRILAREQLRWDNEVWVIKGTARFGWFLYKLQEVSGERRERMYASAEFRIERSFGRHLAVFAAGEHEWNRSNDPLDEYNTWAAEAGVMLSF